MRTHTRRAAVLVTSVAMAGIGTVVGAPAAFAGSDELIRTDRGSVGWYHSGNEIVACDGKKDGLSIEAHYRFVGDTTPGRDLHVAGAGNCDAATWNTYEGANIEISMCYRDDFIITKCSEWQKAQV